MKILLITTLLFLFGCQTVKVVEPVTYVETFDGPERNGIAVGSRVLPPVPVLTVRAVVDSMQIWEWSRKYFPIVRFDLDLLSDTRYALPSKESAIKIIKWANETRVSLGPEFVWTRQVRDCDNFARMLREGAKSILGYSYTDLNAELLVAVIWVRYEVPFANVRDGYHALCAIPYWENGEVKILIVEPQNGIYAPIDEFPNRDGITNAILSGG